MPRSRFEQLIDAGLASPQTPSTRPGSVSSPRRAMQMALPGSPLEFILPAEEAGATKPHLSARDLRRAYRDWQTPTADQRESVAGAPAKPERDASPQTEPRLPDLLAQLANHSQLTREQLQSLRRKLARRLHPDLATVQDRQAATAQMAKLNAIVDKALRTRSR